MACWEAYHQGVKRRCRRGTYIVVENQHVRRPKKTVMCKPCMQRFVAKGWARVIAHLVIGGGR